MDRDWDTLVLLDACRYDIFERSVPFDGSLSKVISRGSHTTEFLQENFGSRTFPDSVYVSATPQLRANDLGNNFHAVRHVWEDGWDDDLRTVPPETMVEATVEAHESYPNKRIISHFLQPHYPFIGDCGRKIDHGTITGGGVLTDERDFASIWELLEAGDVSREAVWNAYVENLELTIPHLERLREMIDGKIVMTSDHGNSLGRMGVYGHPQGYYLSDLVEVPWLELPYDRRREISADGTTDVTTSETVDDRLRDLGYRQ
ncbi:MULTISPECIES: hypothetical protein [unclassified Haladaptatus]|uniref:hypothetical protein n=1 Tax=unclassified Haladaptatus TaxID=2622732 RepID=UPI00209C2E8E|nr:MULTISPECIES: hypothetical protein [unclassified Haladaptatus]MCO8244770.1 hypothetical protein [Haladaptatus sp. AB643]MCO8255718.1 hypothetical protein [Haladaptatus sp. AB618]